MTRRHVHLAPDFSLSQDDAVTGKFAWLGTSGSGKSNGLVVMAEELYECGLPFVTFDPKGDWWGIRAKADGTPGGLDVPIFGAVAVRKKSKPKPDLPLEPEAGRFFAELVVREGLSCVLDVAGFESDADRSRFLRDFGDRLFRLNEDPLHLFFEEVDEYAPQSPMSEDTKTLHVFKRIAKQGRNAGLGISLASQRSAVVNKNVLNLCESLIVSRTQGSHDLDAIGRWLRSKDPRSDILDELPNLADGEVFVISPRLFGGGAPRRIQMRRRWTFDSGATPKVGEKRRAVTLSEIDLDRVRKQMGEAMEEYRDNDPDELKKQLAAERDALKVARASVGALESRLEVETEERKQLEDKAARLADEVEELGQRPESVERVPIPVPFLDEKTLGELDERVTEFDLSLPGLLDYAKGIEATVDGIRKAVADFRAEVPDVEVELLVAPEYRDLETKAREEAAPIAARVSEVVTERRMMGEALPNDRKVVSQDGEGFTLQPAHRKVLDALAWWETFGIPTPSNAQVGAIAGYSIRSGRWSNLRGQLKTAGLIDYPQHGTVALTSAGRVLAHKPEAPATVKALHEAVRGILQGAQWRVLEPLLKCYPRDMSNAELGEAAGYSIQSGRWSNLRGQLKTPGFITYPANGRVRAADWLFPKKAA